jgi:hypothetical protein
MLLQQVFSLRFPDGTLTKFVTGAESEDNAPLSDNG